MPLSMTSEFATKSSPSCQDIRLTQTSSQIQQDAREFLNERQRKRNHSKQTSTNWAGGKGQKKFKSGHTYCKVHPQSHTRHNTYRSNHVSTRRVLQNKATAAARENHTTKAAGSSRTYLSSKATPVPATACQLQENKVK